MVGLDAAGKTTILYKLKLGEGRSRFAEPCLLLELPACGAGKGAFSKIKSLILILLLFSYSVVYAASISPVLE